MNFISLVKNLLLKDVRHQRVCLLIYWYLALIFPLLAPWIRLDASGVYFPMLGMTVGFYFLLGLILIRAILVDPPGRKAPLGDTQAVSGRAVFTSKVLFTGFFLIVPLWIIKVGTTYAVGLPFHFLDAVLDVIEITLEAGAFLAMVVLFSLFLRRLTLVILSLVATTVLLFIAASIWDGMSSDEPRKHLEDASLGYCRLLIFDLALIVTVGVTAFARYRTATLLRPLALFAVGLGLSLALSIYFPWDPSQLFSDQVNTGEVAAPLSEKLHFALTGQEDNDGNYLDGYGLGGTEFFVLNHNVTLEGLGKPYFATLVDYHARATLRSGRVIESSYRDVSAHGWTGGLSDGLKEQLAGFKSDLPLKWNEYSFDIFNFIAANVSGEDLRGASIKGIVTLEIRKALILKTVPLQSGVTVLMPRRRYTLQQVKLIPNGVEVDLLKETAFLTLRGDCPGWGDHDYLTWLIFNQSKGKFLYPGNYRADDSGLPSREFSRSRLDYVLDTGENHQSIPSDWVDGAEICFFTTESCGRISFSYEIPSIDLTIDDIVKARTP